MGPGESQTNDDLEQSGQQKWPLAWQLEHAMDLAFEFSAPNDSYKSSTKVKPNGAPSLINPTPLHFEHAIILKLPHFLHIPRELYKRVIWAADRNQNASIHDQAT